MDHNILLDKLDHYGIRGIALKWFHNYLSNRKQYVSIGNSKSHYKYINIGVLQGSVLGLFLFLIYINDISNITSDDGNNKYNLMLFADDTNIFMSNKNLHLLKEDAESIMNKLCAWF